MTALSIQPPFPLITDIDGQPLEDGYIWIGTANLPPIGNPIAVYWDAALTIPAALPVRTRGGYPVNSGTPARLYVGSDYSILVQNKNGSTLYSAPSATERYSGVVVDISATDVSFLQAGSGAVVRTVQSKLRDVVSVKDFGAVGDGVADDAVAIQAALNYAATTYAAVFLPRGDYRTSAKLTFASATTLFGEGLDQSVIRYYGTGGTALGLEGTISASKVKINLYDFGLYNQGTGATGVNMLYCHYSNLARLRIYGFQVGLVIANCWNNEYDFIISENNSQDGFNLSTTDANALNFVSCQGVGNGRAGFYTDGGRAVLMSNCTWEANTQYGVWISGQNATRPLGYTIHGCYIEGNGSFEVYIDSQGSSIPAGITIRDTYFEFIAAKAPTAIRIVDGYNVVIDGCTFDDQGGSYTHSLYMEVAGSKDRIRWGRNYDSSTGGVYSEIYYENQTKAEPIAWGRFTVSGGAIATSNSYGVASITYVSTGVYEITLRKNTGVTDYAITASAEDGAAVFMLLCSPGQPISSTVFRIYTGTAVNTLADARTISFLVFA